MGGRIGEKVRRGESISLVLRGLGGKKKGQTCVDRGII